jgi:phosphonate degradation associated HDIG domain protein
MGEIHNVIELLQQAGAHRYGGEAVNQLEHALQCAQLAEADSVAPELVVAALLHDLGHLLYESGEDAAPPAVDDKHQFRAMHLLRRVFGSAVTEPIRLHVDAKRYLCRADAAYYGALSPASKASLELQGGAFSVEEARRFIMQPYGRDAARLRTWDDRAKTAGLPTPDIAHYARIMARCTRP